MLGAILQLISQALGIAEKIVDKQSAGPQKHDWMTVAVKRNGRLVRDKRCRYCGKFRRDPKLDDEICKSRDK